MPKNNIFFNKEMFYIVFALLGMATSQYFSYVIMGILLFLVVTQGREWFIKSIIYLTLLKFVNPIFHPINSNIVLMFLMFLFILILIKIVKKNKLYIYKFEKKYYILITLFLFSSITYSMYPSLSILRLIVYFIIVFTIFQSYKLAPNYNFISFLIMLSTMFIIISALLIFFPFGYYDNGFFMGITNQSQNVGAILVPLLLIYVFKDFKLDIFHLVIVTLGFYEIYLSGSRTAMFAAVGSVSIYYLLSNKSKFNKKKILIFLMSFFILGIVYLQLSSQINSKIESFILKSERASDFTSSAALRFKVMEASKNNFLESPWTGIGFSVQTVYADPRDEDMSKIKYIPGTNLMYSKPLEKGNLYFAVFEEGGIFVGLYFIYILFYLFIYMYRSKVIFTWPVLFGMMLGMNGEAELFAPGGLGSYQLSIIIILYGIASRKYNTKKIKASNLLKRTQESQG